MKKKAIWWLGVVLTSFFLITSCLPWKKKDEEGLYEKGKEGRWVYSQQQPSPYGEGKEATTYSKRPYEAQEGEDVAVDQPKSVVTPYLLGNLKYKVVLLEFQEQTKQERRGLGAVVSQELARQLEESGAVILVDMELIKKSLRNKDHQYLKEPSTLWKMKTLLGVQGVVTGVITDVLVSSGREGKGEEAMAVAKIEATLLDTETGNVIRSVQGENPTFTSQTIGEFSRDKALMKAVSFALQGIREGIVRGLTGLEWSTTVASVEEGKLYLNAGKSTGLKIGDLLEVYGPGKDVKHPVTKVSLGRMPGKLKSKIRVDSFVGIDASEAVIISGEQAAMGDVVRLAK